MANLSNDLSGDPSQLSLKEKLQFFEKNFEKTATTTKPKPLSSLNIFPKKLDTSNSDNNNPTPSPSNQPNLSSSNGYPKKTSTSTTDNNVVSSAPNTSTSLESVKVVTPSSTNSSGNGILSLQPSQQSTAKKPSKVNFKLSPDESLKIPEILEVFTDLDLFIERELNEISARKRIGQRMAIENQDEAVADLMKLKDEYLKDKEQHQRDFEKHKNVMKFATIQEEEEYDELSMDVTITSQMNRLRSKKIEKLNREVSKQENLLSKISRVLDHISIIDERNLAAIINIERHYLVASSRYQAALTELRRLDELVEPLHSRPFHRKGNCTISDIMLEVKPSYFERRGSSLNEFIVVLLKYDDEVYASKAICIIDDVRTIKFPNKFRVPDAFMDFNMRLEVYGSRFWRSRNSIRQTMFKKLGFITFSLADTGEKRKRFDMVEVIKNDRNPLRKKILIKIRQNITADVHWEGVLMIKLGDLWHRTYSHLCGHLLEINLISEEETETMLLDLYNFDSDFIIPVVSHVSLMPFTFLLKFNHYVAGTEFHLLVAAESQEDYSNWVININKALALIK